MQEKNRCKQTANITAENISQLKDESTELKKLCEIDGMEKQKTKVEEESKLI